jgi:hypothetical protein
VTDILIRDVPEAVVAQLDAAAERAGVSRVEYVRRALAAEANRATRDTRPPLTRGDWQQLTELAPDLGDENVMRGAWT